MATATLTPTGSTQQFEVAYPDSSVPSNLTSEREHPERAEFWRVLLPAAPKANYDRFTMPLEIGRAHV